MMFICDWQAFVKARGDGLGFALGSVEFELSKPDSSGSQTAAAKVDRKLLHRCCVKLDSLSPWNQQS